MPAGSHKKRPTDYIFLEIGNTLHDVLRVCTGATLDTLESAVQGAIGPVPKKRTFFWFFMLAMAISI